jgi:hypothetical protein
MFDFLGYALFVAAIIGFLRFSMRDLPSDEVPRTSPPIDQASNDR